MRTKKVTRHYCDFCSRGSFSKPAMVKHERGCCKNKDRVCGFCADVRKVQTPYAEICQAAEDGFSYLMKVTDCPACILSGVLHAGKAYKEDGEWYETKGWTFKKALEEFWSEKNQAELEAQGNRG